MAQGLTLKKLDGWVNELTQLGLRGRDKRLSAKVRDEQLTEEDAEALWQNSDQAARVIELPPLVQLRNGFRVVLKELERRGNAPDFVERFDADEKLGDAQRALDGILSDLEATAALIEASQWARAYGGCALLVGVDDGQTDLSKPINLAGLKSVRYLAPLRPRECWPLTWNANPNSGGFGRPVVYQVQRESFGGVGVATMKVHASRIIRFEGKRTSRRHGAERHGWGDSVLRNLLGPLRAYESAYEQLETMLGDHGVPMWSMSGLAELIATGQTDVVKARIEAANSARSAVRAHLVDKEDTFSVAPSGLTGIGEAFAQVAQRWAAATGFPATLLFGDAPSGLGSNGDVSVRWFMQAQGGERELSLRPRVNRLARLVLLSRLGPTGGVEPSSWSVTFGALWEPTPQEEDQRRKSTAETDAIYLANQVVTPEEVARSRFGGEAWSQDMQLDMDARDDGGSIEPEDDTEEPAEEPGDMPGEEPATP